MNIYMAFIIAEIKMFTRDRAAIFWTVAFPTVLMLIFGFLSFDRYDPPDVGIIDQAQNSASQQLTDILSGADGQPELLSIEDSNDPQELETALIDGDINTLITIPPNFGDTQTQTAPSLIAIRYNSSQPQEAFAAEAVIEEALERIFMTAVQVPPQFQRENWAQINLTPTETAGQGYKGFIVSGIVALSVMQSAVFGVVFTFVRLRSQGVLRRFQATPINPSHFLIANLVTRIIIIAIQAYLLLLIGQIVLGVTIGPDNPTIWVQLLILIVFASAVFTSFGLAISSIAKTENTAAPIANAIILPMMFLSGVFFPRSVVPDWLAQIADFFPLTYLADSMRSMVNTGDSIFSQGPELLGLAVWAAIIFTISTLVFKWE